MAAMILSTPIRLAGVIFLTALTFALTTGPTPCSAAPETAARDEGDGQRVLIDTVLIRGNVRTRDEVIRRELLFGRGDWLDAALLRETERNLRRLLYLGRARISTSPAPADPGSPASAQVLVEVEDLYSRALSPVLSGELGELSYGVVGLDYNFLGLGQLAQLELRHDAVAGNSGSLTYRVPRLAGSRAALTADLGVGQEGHNVGLSLFRPYYALSTRWTYGVTAFSHEAIQRLYSDRGLAARYEDRVEGGSLWVGHSWSRGSVKVRPSFRISASDRRFRATNTFTYAPAGRRRVLLSTGLVLWRPRYARTRYIRSLGPVEDLQTGSWLALRAGLSHRSLGSDRNFPFFLIQLSPRFQLGDGAYAFLSFHTSTRIRDGGYHNLFTSTQLLAYVHPAPRHTLALRLQLDTVDRPEEETQFLLGVNRGLRGYPPRGLEGRRRLLLNAELRPTLYARPAWVLAAALFADGGTAWTPGESSPDLDVALGVGGRLGLSRIYDTPVLRADLARGLGDGVWQLSIGLGQYF